MSATDLKARPSPPWLVKDVLPPWGLGAIFGFSGSGKSFLQLDLAAALAEGRPWFGHFVQRARRIIIVYLEGADGIRRRVVAWEAHHGRPFPETVGFLSTSLNLGSSAQVQELAVEIRESGGADVVFIDTLARAMPGLDENSPAAMGTVIEHAGHLQTILAALVVLVSHTGKNESAGLRGHSSLHAALDASIQVSRDGRGRRWKLVKSKDGPEGIEHPFELQPVAVDLEEAHQGSCVVVPVESFAPPSPALRPRGKNQQMALPVVLRLLGDATEGIACADLEREVAGTLTVKEKRRGERARVAIKGLDAQGFIEIADGKAFVRGKSSR